MALPGRPGETRERMGELKNAIHALKVTMDHNDNNS
jgi:hypothetical protein